MKLSEELHAVLEAIASSAKLSVGISAVTASLGVASAADMISGALSSIAIVCGIVVTAMLGRVHWQAYENHLIQNKIFRRQLLELGGDPDKDE